MTPTEASNPNNEVKVAEALNKNVNEVKKSKPRFKVGDNVRISRIKQTFEKGHTTNWSHEVFTISEVLDTLPITYKIIDYLKDPIEGSFYSNELLKTDVPDYHEV